LSSNVDNFEDVWTATEQLKTLPSRMLVYVDPEKMIAARRAGASPWEVHERAFPGEFAPTKPYDLHTISTGDPPCAGEEGRKLES
jgi:catechol 2,3-dioxygenase